MSCVLPVVIRSFPKNTDCAVCEPNFSAKLGSTCSPCSGSLVWSTRSVGFLLFLLALFMLWKGCKHLASLKPEDSWFCEHGLCRCCCEPGHRSFWSSFKIIIVAWQIVTQVNEVFFVCVQYASFASYTYCACTAAHDVHDVYIMDALGLLREAARKGGERRLLCYYLCRFLMVVVAYIHCEP